MDTLSQQERLTGKLQFRVPRALQQKVRIAALRRDSSVQEICTEAILRYLESIKPKKSEAA